MKRIGINSGRTDGDTIIRLLLLDSILVEFYTRFTSKWDYQWEHLEWKKKKKKGKERGKKKETHRSQFGSSHCRWKSISIGGSLARKKEERREESAARISLSSRIRVERAALPFSRQSLSLSISVYELSPLCAFLYFILHVRRYDARRREILDGDFCKVLRSLNSF